MKIFARLAVVALCGFAPALAQDFFSELLNPLSPFPPRPAQGSTQPQHHEQRQSQNQNGPWSNDVLVYRIKADGTAEALGGFERAGVPTLTRLQDGRLLAAFQHFPANDPQHFDRVAVCFSSNEGSTWTQAQPIVVEGMEEGLMRPFDPTLVALPDGSVRMYFTSNRHHDFGVSRPEIYSALSKDGVHYTFEPGARFGIEDRVVIDCAAVLHQGVFHLYSPDNGSTADFHQIQSRQKEPPSGSAYHATSTDGLNFTRVDDVRLEEDMRWLGNAQSDGQTITFFGSGRGIAMATSTDGVAWQSAGRHMIAGADPGAVQAKEGGWIIIATGPPREGRTRSAQDQWLADWTAERQMFETLARARHGSP